MQFFSAVYRLISLRSKYSPQHPVLKHPQSLNTIGQVSHPYRTTGKSTTFWALLATCFHVGFLLCFWTLKLKAICSSETSVDFRGTTRRYIPAEKVFGSQEEC
jgi:hypothetical protein